MQDDPVHHLGSLAMFYCYFHCRRYDIHTTLLFHLRLNRIKKILTRRPPPVIHRYDLCRHPQTLYGINDTVPPVCGNTGII